MSGYAYVTIVSYMCALMATCMHLYYCSITSPLCRLPFVVLYHVVLHMCSRSRVKTRALRVYLKVVVPTTQRRVKH